MLRVLPGKLTGLTKAKQAAKQVIPEYMAATSAGSIHLRTLTCLDAATGCRRPCYFPNCHERGRVCPAGAHPLQWSSVPQQWEPAILGAGHPGRF
ncbi:MAG TPA: hypothetical protein VM223_09545 [Planctomycetota bacterium]|nr:hypothetical protein [Planctomycetota bacterium]